MSPVLKVSRVGKAFQEYASELQRFANWFGLVIRPASQHWVLRDVSFSVAPGEAVGIIGQNGAGKSTLLKMITGTLPPTEGSVEVVGRISAILELGMGFNPELTGRQNVYHSAGLMGFDRQQITCAIHEIEAFAEIGEYFDQAVRTYSSGMQMRVAFAVATAFRPAILIVDEALSVGDAYFQHKCFERIRSFQKEGTTLLIVSHDNSAVQALCDRAVLLDRGHLIKDGAPSEVIDFYNALIAEKENATVSVNQLDGDGAVQTISGTGEAVVGEISLHDENGDPVEFINVGAPVELRVKVRIAKDIPRLVFGYMLKDRFGKQMFGTNTYHTDQVESDLVAGSEVVFSTSFNANLGAGSYSVSTALVSTDTHLVDNFEWRDLALVFTVSNFDKPYFVGSNWMPPVFKVTK
ncbi:ABC transporter ATP-binding protein [Luteibacter yeojuensis]|uniref:Sugar ABC transporter ATP-binding protein n=1 Tax=Luteibacter yeojuensis TaxID=345309 RepID=A0A0F3KKG9_9GAMM|nr:ABC transporter ATP-binding protein [Luteibacter yeojuensis]KJV31651.1 sugar ABC transporter ATP-binding protein [Luteibacter yeojuensis]